MQKQNSLIIRPIEPEDAADYYALYNHAKVVKQFRHLPSVQFAEIETWIKKEEVHQHRLVATQNGRILGSVQLTHATNVRMRHSGTIELMVHPDFWRMGIGTALLEAILNIADDWLNLTRIQAAVFTDNQAAIHLLTKMGFGEEGVRKKVAFGNGRFQDDLVMVRLRNTFIYDHQRSTPSPSRPTGAKPSGDIFLRPIKPADLKDISKLYQFSAVCRTTLQLPSQEIWRYAHRVSPAPARTVRYVAESNGKVVGMGSLHQSPKIRSKHSAGLGMTVHPNYWGMGIGSQLMTQLLESADNWLNLIRVELEVNNDNPPAVALYRKFGFVIEGTHQYHAYGDGRMADSYFMARIKE